MIATLIHREPLDHNVVRPTVTYGELRAARQALASKPPASPPPVAVDGWRLVPVEPTPEMDRAGANTFGGQGDSADARYECAVMYRAMLAASPSVGGAGEPFLERMARKANEPEPTPDPTLYVNSDEALA